MESLWNQWPLFWLFNCLSLHYRALLQLSFWEDGVKKRDFHRKIYGGKFWARTWTCFRWKNLKRWLSRLWKWTLYNKSRVWSLDEIQFCLTCTLELCWKYYPNFSIDLNCRSLFPYHNYRHRRNLFLIKIRICSWLQSMWSQRSHVRCSSDASYSDVISILYHCKPCLPRNWYEKLTYFIKSMNRNI